MQPSQTIANAASAAASGVAIQKGAAIQIPASQRNPYLKTSSFKQGTFYVIIFPIIAAILLFYLCGVLINKLRANKQARYIEPFDREYEYNLDRLDEDGGDDYDEYSKDNNNDGDHDDDNDHNLLANVHSTAAVNPFSDKYMASNHSFLTHHKKNASSVDFISQYRRSMEHLAGFQDPTPSAPLPSSVTEGGPENGKNANGHKRKNKSIGSVLQLNINDQTILKPYDEATGQPIESPVCYSPINNAYGQSSWGAESGTDNSVYVDAPTSTRGRTNTGTTSYYSLPEPTKAATPSVITPANIKNHGHTRTLSSHLLDAFISTGELPMLKENARTAQDVRTENENNNTQSHNQIMHSPNHSKHDLSNNSNVSINIEHHSMFDNTNLQNAYSIPNTNMKLSPVNSNASSPRRARVYRQQTSLSPTRDTWSRGSSKSPIRNSDRSPIRADKSPSRGSFGII